MDLVLVNYVPKAHQSSLLTAMAPQVRAQFCLCAYDYTCDCVKMLCLAPCLYEYQPVLIIVEWATWQNMHATAMAASYWKEQPLPQEGNSLLSK